MKIRLVFSAAVFTGSYLPLAVILLVQDFNYSTFSNGICTQLFHRPSSCAVPFSHPGIAAAMLLVTLSGFMITLLILKVARPRNDIRIVESKYIPAELMSYTLPYVVSFMSIGYQETAKFSGLFIFLVWMFWITHTAGQVLLNPILTVCGWRLHEVKYAFSGESTIHTGRALAKGTVEANQHFAHTTIQDILVLRIKKAKKVN